MTTFREQLAFGGLLLALLACDSPVAPHVESARPLRGVESALCDATTNPICSAFVTTTYSYNPTVAPLPPGVSDWTLKVTQLGGVLEFFGAISHGGPQIADLGNMYVRFYIDNGNSTLGAGDLMVVIRSDHGSAAIHCGIVSTLPTGAVIAPTDAASLCPVNGFGYDDGSRFIFDGFRTADLTETALLPADFQPLAAGQTRSLFLFEVGNVSLAEVLPTLLPPTAPTTVAYAITAVAGPPPIDEEPTPGEDPPGGGTSPTDTIAPTVLFAGNGGSYELADEVLITCTATDAGSGIATASCPTAAGVAYTFGTGVTTLTAVATDSAGNTARASTSFSVEVTVDGLCALAKQWAKNRGIGNSLCAQLSHKKHGAFLLHVRALRSKMISPEHADLLTALAGELHERCERPRARGDSDDDRADDSRRDSRRDSRHATRCRGWRDRD